MKHMKRLSFFYRKYNEVAFIRNRERTKVEQRRLDRLLAYKKEMNKRMREELAR